MDTINIKQYVLLDNFFNYSLIATDKISIK